MNTDMISKRLKIISDLQEEINRVKALYDESLENDPIYQKLQEESKKFKEETKEKKTVVKSNSSLKNMEEEMRKIKDELKENREVLAQELADYYKDSGSMEITDEDGNTKRIIFSVKLINS